MFSEILTHLSTGENKALYQLRRESPSRFGGTVALSAYCHLSNVFHMGEIPEHTKKRYSIVYNELTIFWMVNQIHGVLEGVVMKHCL